MTVEENIQQALFARVATLNTTPGLSIAWPNAIFRPPAGPYLVVQHLPNRNARILIKGSGPHLRRGILQLTVASILNAGPTTATALAGSVAAHFPADLELFSEDVKVAVEAAPDVAPAMRDDAAWSVPISIRYQAFA